ncbi:MAG: crotonase/enoyl-CoA hydratase family protein [Solirubrobacterales bacterium]|nr:crotonase/enoyl-CoA hydratase family protein [Solirubrobacterales bacterium]
MTTVSAEPDTAQNTERVTVEIEGPIAVVSLNRPDKLNALNFEIIHGLIAAARKLKNNRQVRAVILVGEGKAFSSGLDFASVGKQPLQILRGFLKWPWQDANSFQEVSWAWRQLPQPVIAVLHGRCYGGGLQIALGADFRIASPDCELSVMEARWGLIPDMSGSVTLQELVGLDTAKRLTMTGEVLSGSEAQSIGLVSEVNEFPLGRAHELADQLAQRSPDAVTASKRLLNQNRHQTPRKAFKLERALQLELLRGANHKIARAAGKAKETPNFRDRA